MRRRQSIVLADEPGRLVIHLLGGFRVEVGARAIADSAWRLRKAKSLVKLLALAPSHELHREQALDLLWSDLTPEAAAHNLHQALYTARRTIFPQSSKLAQFLVLREDVLSLAPPDTLWIDVEAFEAAAEQAHRLKQEAPYRAALDLYGGALLPEDRYEDWVSRRRDALHAEHLSLLIELAALYESQQHYALGIETLQRARAADPGNEDAHRGLMRLHALSGHRQLSLRQFQSLREALQREVDAEPDAESQRLYEAISAGQFPPSKPPLESSIPSVSAESALPLVSRRRLAESERHKAEGAPGNLPSQLATFVGREQERAEVKRRLASSRLLTLVGSGGSGKTRLAIQVAGELQAAHEFPDGVWLIELAALSEPSLVPQAVAAALRVGEQAGMSMLDTLRAHLKPLRVLLVLDNCEHLIGACAELAESLLRACPDLRILATSREPLHILGELTWRVPSLALPDLRQNTSFDDLQTCDSIRLFVERANAVMSSFTLTPQNAPSVARICARLDGIPLAIELAAARVNALSIEQIAARIADAFNLLTGGSRTALPRQQTLLALMDWSYTLLSEQERMLWRRLSVFADGFTLEAAEFVCGGTGVGEHEASAPHSHAPTLNILNLLSQLVNKSLVQAEPNGDGVRYSLLQTVRLYAQDKLLESLEATLTHQRHRQYYLTLAERAELELLGPNQSVWLSRLESEYDNLLDALVWTKQRLDLSDDPEAGDADALMRLCGALWTFWYARGSLSEGRQWLAEALAWRDTINDRTRAALVKVLAGAGVLAWSQGDFAHAQSYSQESLDLAHALDIRSAMVVASLTVLGMIAQDRGDLPEAIARYEESLMLMRAAGIRFGIALALNALATALRHRAEYARATELFEEGLRLQREIGDRWGMALSLHNLGEVALDQGDYARAQTYNEESEALFRAVGSLWGVAIALSNLGEIAYQRGEYEHARRHLHDSLDLLHQLEDKTGVARTTHNLASVARGTGDEAQAKALLQQSLAMRAELGDRPGLVANLEELAALVAYNGHAVRAARLFGAAEALQQTLTLPRPPLTRADPLGFVANARAASRQDRALAAAWAEGRALSLEQAIAYALEKDGDD